jgi:NitT/TauT family transport system substrate-binding protein
MRVSRWAALPLLFLMLIGRAQAAETIRLALLKFGTVSWEIDVIRHHRLDEKHGVRLEVTELAGTQATAVALQAGSADMMVTDWLWVSRQRGAGADFTMLPYSTASGAVMVPPGSPIASLADLKGKRLGVAGGPIDKSWLMLRAHTQRTLGFDIGTASAPAYGAPPLLSEKLAQGELDAVLTYWHFAARLEAKGFKRLAGMSDITRALGGGALVVTGYAFREGWAAQHRGAVEAFRRAAQDARAIMAKADEEWERLAPLTQAEDAATLAMLRDRYREGIPAPGMDDAAGAQAIFTILSSLGGAELTGGQTSLAPGTFWGHGG